VDIPGKFYKFGDDPALDQQQYADMSNGSYYMVTRVMTNAWMWNHGTDEVYRTIDSLLYENVPGKIIAKTAISKNGYRGFDITNKTRRGDLQRYNIFITPFEVVFFKISGNGDYIKNGTEAGRFFGSIQLKEYRNGTASPASKPYTPPYGGFSADFPHEPYIGNDGSWIYDAADKTAGIHYRLIRTDIHNFHFAEEDSFDLGLMEESFASSEFIDTQLIRRHFTYKGYPALDCKYRDRNGSLYLVRFIIQGPHYYSLLAHGKQESPAMTGFLNSFEIKPFAYGAARLQKDTSLYFTVSTPVYPADKKIKLNIPRVSSYSTDDDDGRESEDDLLEGGAYRNRTISNDSTGEKIFVSFYRSPRYYYTKDSSALDNDNEHSIFGNDSAWIVKYRKRSLLTGNMKVWELLVTDTGSSRALWGKSFYKDGIGFSITTQTDTLTKPGAFIKSFFDSFTPADTLRGIDPLSKKTTLFFEDFFSSDSILHRRAVKHIDDIDLDAADLPQLKKSIAWLNWSEKEYLDTKSSLISRLGDITTTASADYLRTLYYSLDDTVELQYTTLESLLQHKTQYAYHVFRDIINNEPPVLTVSNPYADFKFTSPLLTNGKDDGYDNGNFLDELSDSLQLTKTILPELLPLLNLQDYKSPVMKLLGEMVDSSLAGPKDYDQYFSKFLIEAKQEMKKQSIAEKKKAIQKAEEDKKEKKPAYSYYTDDEKDAGNDDLGLYATLLLPYWDSNSAVRPLLQQMLGSGDKQLKYNTLLLMLKNNKPFPDTLLRYFGSLGDYRYQLYTDLKAIKKPELFPAVYNNHLDLGMSSLLDKKTYSKPDSVIYIDRLTTTYRGKKGFLYFYKYKVKKDDLTWKLATVGLVPEDPAQFGFDDTALTGFNSPLYPAYRYNPYSFTGFSETRFRENEPVMNQLKQLQKKLLYSRRKSAKNFYDGEYDRAVSTEHTD